MDFFSLRVSSVKNLAGLLSFVSVVLYIMYKTMWIVVFTRTSHVRSIDTTLLHILSSTVYHILRSRPESRAHDRLWQHSIFWPSCPQVFSGHCNTAQSLKLINQKIELWYIKKKPKFSKCFHFNAILGAISCWKNYC